jgi:hypothetical protein
MRRAGVPVVIASVLVGALLVLVPHLRSQTISDGTPVPRPVSQLSLFPLLQGQAGCLDEVAVEPGRQVAFFGVDTAGQKTPPLRFTIRAGSYDRSARVPAGFGAGQLTVPFAAPQRSLLAKICVQNLGRVRVWLRGTSEARTLSRPRMTVGGRPVEGEFSLAFESADGVGAFDLVATIATRMTAFRPIWVQPWLVVALLTVVLVGAFVAPLVALWRSFVFDEYQ